MDDRELLEMAAKACGKGPILHNDGILVIFGPSAIQTRWAPLFEDADALRLMVRLKISFICTSKDVHCGGVRPDKTEVFVLEKVGAEGLDHATRRAIVRAAAEIGRSMP